MERRYVAFPAANATGDEVNTNYNQLVIKTDEGNTLYVDEIVMDGADPVIPAPSVPTDLVANGAFDDAAGWTGAGVNAVDGVNRVNNDTVAANSYDVNMQTTVDLEPGNTYTLTFEARGEAGRLFDVGIGDSAAPYGSLIRSRLRWILTGRLTLHLELKYLGYW